MENSLYQNDCLRKKQKTIFFLWTTILLSFIFCLIIYRKFVFGDAYYVCTTDAAYQFYPYVAYLARSISDLQLPSWTWMIGMGDIYPLRYIGDISVVISCIFGEGALPYLLIYVQIIKIVLAAAFIFLFLKKIRMSDIGSMLGAIAYSFSSIMIIRGLWFAYSMEMLLFAFLLWALERYFQNKKRGPLLVALFLLFIYKGMYYIVLYCIVCFVYATVRYYLCHGSIFNKKYVRYIADGILMIILAGGLSCVINVPYLIQTLNTGRFDSAFNAQDIPLVAGFDRVGSAILKCFSSTLFDDFGGDMFIIDNGLDGALFYFGVFMIFIIPMGYYIENDRIKKLLIGVLAFAVVYIVFPIVTYICNMGISFKYFKLSSLWFCTGLLVMSVYIFDHVVLEKRYGLMFLLISTCAIVMLIGYLCFVNSMFSAKIRKDNAIYIMVLALFYMIILFIYKKRQYIFIPCIILLTLCVELVYSANRTSDIAYMSAIAMMYQKGLDLKTDNELSEVAGMKLTYERVAWYDKYPSRALLYDINGVGYYDDIGQGYVNFVNNVMSSGGGNEHSFTEGKHIEYWLSDIFLGVKYRIVEQDDVLLSNIYEIVEEYDDGRKLVENKEAFSLGTMYDNYLSYEQLKTLENEEKQYNLLNSIVCDNKGEGELIQYTGRNIEDLNASCDIDGVMSGNTDTSLKLNIPEEITTIVVPVEGNEDNTYTISFQIHSKQYDGNICNISWYDGKEWNYLGDAKDKMLYEIFHVDNRANRFKISDSNIQAIAFQFKNGQDSVTISNLKICEYDEDVLNANLEALVNEREEQGSLEVYDYDDTKIKGKINCTKDGTLLLTIPYNVGWKAYVDGKIVETYCVDYGFTGIDMTEGVHEVELKFELPGLKIGLVISICSMIMAVFICVRLKKSEKDANEKIDL